MPGGDHYHLLLVGAYRWPQGGLLHPGGDLLHPQGDLQLPGLALRLQATSSCPDWLHDPRVDFLNPKATSGFPDWLNVSRVDFCITAEHFIDPKVTSSCPDWLHDPRVDSYAIQGDQGRDSLCQRFLILH
jgi:hypothetical protein